jgi:dipeptidyl aminopeptidase/acylaminoacyl peptidase
VNPDGLFIHGGSSGGMTTLNALAFHEVFTAGASYYGIADLTALASETHKFEARYLDSVVAPWPEGAELYRERSVAFHKEKLRRPVIIFQGLDDTVVPPNQAEMLVTALRSAGIPFAYISYEGEGHGFRQAANIMRTAEAELSFYGQVLGIAIPDIAEPVFIENAQALTTA